jgi:hypothetical protein
MNSEQLEQQNRERGIHTEISANGWFGAVQAVAI